MRTINDYSIKKKNIILRVDLNVPVIDGKISDNSRIESIKSTTKKLIAGQNKIFILSHFGRPKGKYVKKFSLEFICQPLCKDLNLENIHFLDSVDGQKIINKQKSMNYGEICLLENIRFYPEEEKNDINFAKKLSQFFDIYINDAFSASHRNHASIAAITKFLPSLAGDSFINEIKNLDLFINNPKRPNTAIIGGSKISTKISLLNNLIEYFDNIIVGGAMANTFLLAKGLDIGTSLVEKNYIDLANEILLKSKKFSCNFFLPVDVVSSNNIKDKTNVRHSKVDNVLSNQMILDIGDTSIKKINEILLKSKMILWNGPLGVFEHKPFDYGTMELNSIIKKYSKKLAITTLAGGGDTISAIKMARSENSFTYISNAGGAFLEWFEGKESPGVRALKENMNN